MLLLRRRRLVRRLLLLMRVQLLLVFLAATRRIVLIEVARATTRPGAMDTASQPETVGAACRPVLQRRQAPTAVCVLAHTPPSVMHVCGCGVRGLRGSVRRLCPGVLGPEGSRGPGAGTATSRGAVLWIHAQATPSGGVQPPGALRQRRVKGTCSVRVGGGLLLQHALRRR